jgi:O-antigen/teichoic acid export membrane protein
MKWFYLRVAIVLFLFLSIFGTLYIFYILKNYEGDKFEVYVAWVLLCLINTYNIFTLYYDALLQGKGLIKESKQITVIGYMIYLIISSILIIFDYGIIAIVSAQVFSVIIIRFLSNKVFFTKELKKKLKYTTSRSKDEILKAIYPNAMKIGITLVGGVMVQRSAIIIGSFYLPLIEIGSYGITTQLLNVIASLSSVYSNTYYPKITQLRTLNKINEIKKIYLNGQIILFLSFFSGGVGILIFGIWGVSFIGSQTELIQTNLILIALVFTFLENNHSIAGGILLTKNEVPFFKAALLSGVLTIFLLLIFFKYTNFGLLGMILAPGIAQGLYQNWKWPFEVKKELKISRKDISKSLIFFIVNLIYKFKSIKKSKI